jgi:complement component 1 Q subcomponent-binding protein, mitochondrial
VLEKVREYSEPTEDIARLDVFFWLNRTGLVTMKREYKGESIEITFDCQDETAVDDDDDDDEDEELETANEEDGLDENPKEVGTNFEVKITKANGEKLLVSMIASRNPSILGVRYLTAIQDATEPSGYGGPIFHQLNEDLQEAFYAYLQERNVDDDLSFFILSYSRVKEQTEYRNWLNSVMAFVQK